MSRMNRMITMSRMSNMIVTKYVKNPITCTSSLSYRYLCQSKQDNEIERKFLPSDSIIKVVSLVAKTKRVTVFTDIYYEIDELFTLTSRDIWLRRRNKSFELKWPMKSSTNSHDGLTGVDFYHETTSLEKIGEIIKLVTDVDVPLRNDSVVEDVLSKSNITRFAEITTTRTRYEIEISELSLYSKVQF